MVATILDEALGTAATRAGATGLTAGINIRYKTGIPLHTPLEVTCRYSHTEGRKHIATGEIRTGRNHLRHRRSHLHHRVSHIAPARGRCRGYVPAGPSWSRWCTHLLLRRFDRSG